MIYAVKELGGVASLLAADGWDETKHPRDEQGRFKKGNGDISKEEYGQVVHILNNNLTKEQRRKKIIQKAIGNYVYTVANYGFNEYKILKKERIDEFD